MNPTSCRKTRAAAAVLVLLATTSLAVPAQAAADPHHPDAAAQTQPMPGAAGQNGQGGMMGNAPMMNMMPMTEMMRMMQMMRMGGMMGAGAPGIGMIDRIEGRIAFLKAEIKITDAQSEIWNGFADALRANARNLGAARSAMMGPMASDQMPTLAQRLDAQERWLTTRLEGTRVLKTASARLYSALSDEQKKAADELLTPQMGMMRMGQMGQMPSRP